METKEIVSGKIKELFGSLRFWLLTTTALLMILQLNGVIDGPTFDVIKTWLLAVFGVGTLDSIADKIGGKK